jgi:hypothetical protein
VHRQSGFADRQRLLAVTVCRRRGRADLHRRFGDEVGVGLGGVARERLEGGRYVRLPKRPPMPAF